MGKVLGVKTRFLKNWLRAQNSSWFKKGIDALVCRWHKTVEVGECTEKWGVQYVHLVILRVLPKNYIIKY